MNKFNAWNIHKLTTNNSTDNFYEDTKKFYDLLVYEHKKHLSNVSDEGNHFREIATIKSPMTVFNGKWGSGKTFFIENFKINFEKLSNDHYFEEFIYIDAMEILEDEDVILQLIKMIADSESTFGKKVEEIIENPRTSKVVEGTMAVGGVLVSALLEKLTGINIKNAYNAGKKVLEPKNNKPTAEEDDPIKINKKTLIFIDNLERIGKESKKILKAVYKLRMIDNLYFILISNIYKMQDFFTTGEDKGEEFPIYKFVNTSIFDFEQNYSSVLLNFIQDLTPDEINIINKCLNNTSDGEQLSIRQFSNWARDVNFWEAKTKLERMKKISSFDNVDVIPEITNEYSVSIVKQKNAYLNLFNGISNKYNKFLEKINYEDTDILVDKFDSELFSESNLTWIRDFDDRKYTINNLITEVEKLDYFITLIENEFLKFTESINIDRDKLKDRQIELDDLKSEMSKLLENKNAYIDEKTDEYKLKIESDKSKYDEAKYEEDRDAMIDFKREIDATQDLLDTVNDSNEIQKMNEKISEL